MSEENLSLYREAIAAWNQGDRAAWLKTVAPDWEFRTTGTFPGFKAVYRGPEGAAEFWETLREPWEEFRIEIVDLHDAGELVVALLRFHGRGRESGAETTLEYAHLATVVDGQATRLQGFLTHREALEAAGLSE